MKKHSADTAWPAVREVMGSLKEIGITDFGAVGFCFGGSYSGEMINIKSNLLPSPLRHDAFA